MTDKMHNWLTAGERPALPFYVSSFARNDASGGNADDDDDSDDDEDDDDSDDDEDDDESKTDAELRAELKETRASLAKANGQSAKRRRALRAKDAELVAERTRRAAKKTTKAGDDDDAPDLDEIRETAKRDGESSGILRAKKAEAKAELLAAGVSRERVARAVGLLELDDMDLDDDGLDGVDDAIDDLKKTWPELFAKRRTRRESVAGDGDRDGKESASRRKPLTASQQAAAKILGR